MILYQLLVGGEAHPYIGEEQLDELFQDPVNRFSKAAVLIYDAPAMTWSKTMTEAYPPELLQLVSSLLVRDQGRAGLKEVRKILMWHL